MVEKTDNLINFALINTELYQILRQFCTIRFAEKHITQDLVSYYCRLTLQKTKLTYRSGDDSLPLGKRKKGKPLHLDRQLPQFRAAQKFDSALPFLSISF